MQVGEAARQTRGRTVGKRSSLKPWSCESAEQMRKQELGVTETSRLRGPWELTLRGVRSLGSTQGSTLALPIDLLTSPRLLPGTGGQGAFFSRSLSPTPLLSILTSPLVLPGYSSHGHLNIALLMSEMSTDFS